MKWSLREIKEHTLCKSIALNPSKSNSKVPDLTSLTMLKRGCLRQAFTVVPIIYQMPNHGVMEKELGTQRTFLKFIHSTHIYWVLSLCQTEEKLLLEMLTWNKRQILGNC